MSLRPTNWIWFNGKLVPWEQATVHVMTYALHMGASVFEGIRCYDTPRGPALFRLQAHLRRFEDSARIYGMQMPHKREEMTEACRAVVRDNGLRSAYLRPLAWLGVGNLSTNPIGHPTEMMVAAIEWGAYHGAAGLEEGVDVCVSSWRRPAPDTIPTGAKAGGTYLSSQLIALEAHRNGYAEGIALDIAGNLSEGSAENLFLVRDGVIFTPPLTSSVLPGITRDSMMTLARSLGYEVREERLPREALYGADEIFLTGTAAEVTPVRSVDRIAIGDGRRGPVATELQRAFFGLFTGETEDRWGWLEPVCPGEFAAASHVPEANEGKDEMDETFVHTLFEIIDGRDWARLAEVFHPEATYERPGYEPFVGLDRLDHFYREERVIAGGRHHLDIVTASDTHATCCGRFVGVHRDGSPIDERFADFYTLEDGRIKHRTSFFFRAAV